MSYFQSLDSIPEEIESTLTGVSFSTIEYMYDSFLEKIESGKLSDIKIKDIIVYGDYLEYDRFIDPKTRIIYQKLWTNKRFLKNLLELLIENKSFLEKVRKYYINSVNIIAYEYYTATDDTIVKDSEVL